MEKGIVLVHGYMDSHRMPWWSRHENILENYYDEIRVVNLGDVPGTTIRSPENYAREVAETVDDVEDLLDEVHLVGHSMGGINSRWCVEKLGCDSKVDELATFGSPHKGTVVAHLGLFSPGGRDMLSSSDLIEQLNSDGVSSKIDYHGIWGTKDMLVRPLTNAKIPKEHRDNVENYKINCGHLRMMLSKREFLKSLKKAGLI